MSGFIVVGLSGSEHSHPALAWGVEYARTHHLRLELVHVVDDTWGETAGGFTAAAIRAAEPRVTEEADRVSSNHPDLAVRGVVVVGHPERALCDAAEGAELLVIGSHPLERFGGQVFSRRASRIAERASCTVVVVPAGITEGTGVVVGVDGSELSEKAIRFAAAEADRVGDGLTAVHAWAPPWPWDADPGTWPDAAAPEDEVLLSESVAGLAEDYPDLTVTRELPTAPPADALRAAADGARMLVVGSHGRQGVSRAWFGSVSADVVLAMPCTVVVVR